MTQPTIHEATTGVLAAWETIPKGSRPAALREPMKALAEAQAAYSTAQSERVNRSAVGRKKNEERRAVVRELLLAGLTRKAVCDAARVGNSMVTSVAAELREAGLWPVDRVKASEAAQHNDQVISEALADLDRDLDKRLKEAE